MAKLTSILAPTSTVALTTLISFDDLLDSDGVLMPRSAFPHAVIKDFDSDHGHHLRMLRSVAIDRAFVEAKAWCREMMPGRFVGELVTVSLPGLDYYAGSVFHFSMLADATYFKLRWR